MTQSRCLSIRTFSISYFCCFYRRLCGWLNLEVEITGRWPYIVTGVLFSTILSFAFVFFSYFTCFVLFSFTSPRKPSSRIANFIFTCDLSKVSYYHYYIYTILVFVHWKKNLFTWCDKATNLHRNSLKHAFVFENHCVKEEKKGIIERIYERD